MERKNYSKPRMAFEEFRADSYCAICPIPAAMVWSPVPEINDVPGWQERTHVDGHGLDHGVGTTNSKGLGVGTIEYRHISADDNTYEHDDNHSYWEIKLTSPARLYDYHNNTHTYTETDFVYPAGSIFYKNYNGEITPVDVDKNRS